MTSTINREIFLQVNICFSAVTCPDGSDVGSSVVHWSYAVPGLHCIHWLHYRGFWVELNTECPLHFGLGKSAIVAFLKPVLPARLG